MKARAVSDIFFDEANRYVRRARISLGVALFIRVCMYDLHDKARKNR